MKITKENLERLYKTMSLADMAKHLSVARSTLYYHMRKLGVDRRSKSEAQSRHLENSTHQRTGKNHSESTKQKISMGTRRFWDSNKGQEQKQRLGKLRRKEWNQRSAKQRSRVLNRLRMAERPKPGELSRFGEKLATFLHKKEEIKTGIKLTPGHVSDIILESHKIVIELILPVSVYGDDQEEKIKTRYNKLIAQLNDVGYRVMVIEDRSNSISLARCQRIYDELIKFFENKTLQQVTIVS